MSNPVEIWKAEKHGFDAWTDILRFAQTKTPMKDIEAPDLERMKWHGVFYRKRDKPGTYMLRIRLTAGECTAEQARAISFIAYEMGYGIVDITTRANVQVQGLAIDSVPKAIERLKGTGLDIRQTGHDNVRNVFGHPLSGIDPDELIDTRQLCRDITNVFLGSRTYSDLPRKLNVSLTGHPDPAIHYWTQDLSYVAHRTESGEVAFLALVGGKQGQSPILGKPLPFLIRPHQVADVARVILDLYREHGDRQKRDKSRFPYLVERIGIDAVAAYLQEHLPEPLEQTSAIPDLPTGYEDLIGWLPQKQPGKWALGINVPLGRLTWQQLEGLAIASTRWGDGMLRVTAEQGAILPNIPVGFKNAVATEIARLRLSGYADSISRSILACTGKQFCNIAVTETKGHAYRLIEELRQRSLTLHGIRIHMSGCPSACAMHFSADIGLKGVRVRRLLGTKEGFDVFLAGGVSGGLHLGIPYRLGVDVDQLPQMVEEVVEEYYQHHRPGQTFSDYWREKLANRDASKVEEEEYQVPTWECDSCSHQHRGEDPPVFCPKCAALRRHFARLESPASPAAASDGKPVASARTPDAPAGYVFAASQDAIKAGTGHAVTIADKELALFRVRDKIVAIDNACPHEGGPLAEGEVNGTIVTCPWHGWKVDTCTGCSIEPAGQKVGQHEVLVQEGNIFVKSDVDKQPAATAPLFPKKGAAEAILTVMDVLRQSPDTVTFRFDNSAGLFPRHLPGQFLRVGIPMEQGVQWRSFTISSSPTQDKHVDITVKCGPAGYATRALHDNIAMGDKLTIKGPYGNYHFDPDAHGEPLVLISAGSGITPMMSIARYLNDTKTRRSCDFIYGARTQEDILFYDECKALQSANPNWHYHVILSQPPESWTGATGRVDLEFVKRCFAVSNAGSPEECRFFLCGPNDFMAALRHGLQILGVPEQRIHTEEFQSAALSTAQ